MGEECFESNVPGGHAIIAMPAGAGKNATRIAVIQTQTRRATKSQGGEEGGHGHDGAACISKACQSVGGGFLISSTVPIFTVQVDDECWLLGLRFCAFILPSSVRILAATGLSAKLRERHEGDDALSNVRSGLFKVTPTVEMKKEKKMKRLNHRCGI